MNYCIRKWNHFFTSAMILVFILGLTACADTTMVKKAQFAVYPNQSTRLARLIDNAAFTQSGKAGFRLIQNGMEAYAYLLYLIKTADVSLDLQYWSLHQDKTGQVLIHQLLNAADRGVKIRLLLDDFIANGGNANLFTLAQHPNIQVRLYNPIAKRQWLRPLSLLTHFNKSNRRMHNKVFIADNQVAIVGGRNVGDAYYLAKPSYFYRDLDVMAIGSATQKVSESFDAYWNARWAVPIKKMNKRLILPIVYKNSRSKLRKQFKRFSKSQYWQALKRYQPESTYRNNRQAFIWANYYVFYDPPSKVAGIKKSSNRFLEKIISDRMKQARNNVNIITPYFVPQKFGLRWTRKLKVHGVKLSVLTNSLAANDFSLSHGAYQNYRIRLLKNGVHLYEFSPYALKQKRQSMYWHASPPIARLHAKAVTIDNRYAFIGSVNFTPRSRYLNTEITVFIDSTQITQQLNSSFSQLLGNGNSYKLALRKVENDDEGNEEMDMTTHYQVVWRSLKHQESITDPNAGLFKQFMISVITLLPIEDLL